MRARWLLALLLVIGSKVAAEAPRPQQIGLSAVLGDKVILSIDGKPEFFFKNQSQFGIQLLQFDNHSALIQTRGSKMTLKLGAAPIHSKYSPSQSAETILYPDNNGMFRGYGSINGHATALLVDTGATTVALGTERAQQLGIDYQKLSGGKTVPVQTATGVVKGYPIILDNVSLGKIRAPLVRALVIEGSGNEVLLGMSFLKRLRVEHAQGVLKLSSHRYIP